MQPATTGAEAQGCSEEAKGAAAPIEQIAQRFSEIAERFLGEVERLVPRDWCIEQPDQFSRASFALADSFRMGISLVANPEARWLQKALRHFELSDSFLVGQISDAYHSTAASVREWPTAEQRVLLAESVLGEKFNKIAENDRVGFKDLILHTATLVGRDGAYFSPAVVLDRFALASRGCDQKCIALSGIVYTDPVPAAQLREDFAKLFPSSAGCREAALRALGIAEKDASSPNALTQLKGPATF